MKKFNSRTKGKVGEREFAALLREHGYDARRGQQFSGSPDSPDVVSPALPWLHIEVKRVQNLNLSDACAQAEGDQAKLGSNGTKKLAWVVAHRKNHAPWLITMRAEFFFDLIREFDPTSLTPRREDAEMETDKHGFSQPQKSAEGAEGSGATPEPTRETRVLPTIFRRDAEKDPRDGGSATDNSNAVIEYRGAEATAILAKVFSVPFPISISSPQEAGSEQQNNNQETKA